MADWLTDTAACEYRIWAGPDIFNVPQIAGKAHAKEGWGQESWGPAGFPGGLHEIR